MPAHPRLPAQVARGCDTGRGKPLASVGLAVCNNVGSRFAAASNESIPVKIVLLVGVALLTAAPAFAQSGPSGEPGRTGTVIQSEPNSTGNDANIAISRGATGADTVTTNSAAGGNAARPEQAIPNSSANGGGR